MKNERIKALEKDCERLRQNKDVLNSLGMKCLYDPRQALGAIGMHHCPLCGDMQIAGMEHINE